MAVESVLNVNEYCQGTRSKLHPLHMIYNAHICFQAIDDKYSLGKPFYWD